MSLEDKIDALTAAVEANTKVQEAILSKISGQAVVNVTSAAPPKAADKPAAEEKPKASRGRAAAKPKIPTVKEIQDKTTAYLDVEDDAEYEERAAVVVQITENFGVKKMSEISDDDRTQAMEMLEAAIAGDDPFADAGETEQPKDEKPARRSLA